MRWIAVLLLLAACGDDSSTDTSPPTTVGSTSSPTSGGSGGSTSATTSGSGSADGTGAEGSTSASPTTTSGSGVDDSSITTTPGLDCTAPADCASCWECAVTEGPCATGYDACLANINCAGSMICIESMCTGDDLEQTCLDTCCMSCTNLGTCGEVDPTVQCVATECAGLCGAPTCP